MFWPSSSIGTKPGESCPDEMDFMSTLLFHFLPAKEKQQETTHEQGKSTTDLKRMSNFCKRFSPAKAHPKHGGKRYEEAERASHILRQSSNRVKPHDWEHDLLQVLEEVLHARHALQQDVQLEPHLHLNGDRGLGFQPEGTLVEIWIGVQPVLELLSIVRVCQVEVRSRHKRRRFDLALGHILNSCAQVVTKAGVLRANCSIGKTLLFHLVLDCCYSKVV